MVKHDGLLLGLHYIIAIALVAIWVLVPWDFVP